MKSAIVVVLLFLFCFPAFAADRNKINRVKDLNYRITKIITGDSLKSAQCEELRQIGRELDELVASETDPELTSLYYEGKNEIRSFCR